MRKFLMIFILSFFICLAGSDDAISQERNSEVSFERHTFLPGYGFKKLSNPEIFQGNKKRKKYFEGWYFKMVSADGSSILSVIPGISLSENGEEQHAFIQLINGKSAESAYYSFPIEAFVFSKKRFAVRIGENYFSEDSLVLNLHDDSTSVKGRVYMSDQVHLSPDNGKKKGIMGWYRYVPFMQCYHGVLSLSHRLDGSLFLGEQRHNFDNGLGYIEKDWGESMPSDWIWMQSNNFSSGNTSFMLSVANIPWMGSSFTGFLGFFYHDSIQQRFGTYTKAQLNIGSMDSDTLTITIEDKLYTYQIETYRSNSGELKAPVKGSMDRRISESIDAKMFLKVMDRNMDLILYDSTGIAGLEIVGRIQLPSKADTN